MNFSFKNIKPHASAPAGEMPYGPTDPELVFVDKFCYDAVHSVNTPVSNPE